MVLKNVRKKNIMQTFLKKTKNFIVLTEIISMKIMIYWWHFLLSLIFIFFIFFNLLLGTGKFIFNLLEILLTHRTFSSLYITNSNLLKMNIFILTFSCLHYDSCFIDCDTATYNDSYIYCHLLLLYKALDCVSIVYVCSFYLGWVFFFSYQKQSSGCKNWTIIYITIYVNWFNFFLSLFNFSFAQLISSQHIHTFTPTHTVIWYLYTTKLFIQFNSTETEVWRHIYKGFFLYILQYYHNTIYDR